MGTKVYINKFIRKERMTESEDLEIEIDQKGI
jgi:hypothetical protein